MKVFCIGPAYSLSEATDLYSKGKFAGHLLYGVNHMNEYGIEVILCSESKPSKIFNKLNNRFKNRFGDFKEQYDAYKRRKEYDVLYGCWCSHIFLLCLLKYFKLYNKPIIALSHSIKDINSYKGIDRIVHLLLDKITYKSCDYIVSINKLGFNTLKNNYKNLNEKLIYIPLAPEVIENNEGVSIDNTIVAAGKTYRDYETLIKAVSKLNYECIIICGNDLNEYIGKYKNIKIINKYIQFDEVLEFYKRAKVVVVPINETGYGMYGYSSVLDCLAVKKPMIVTDTVGLGIPIEEWECGIKVKPKSEIEMRKAIIKIFEDNEAYENYICGIEKSVNKFNIKNFTKEIVNIINRIEMRNTNG